MFGLEQFTRRNICIILIGNHDTDLPEVTSGRELLDLHFRQYTSEELTKILTAYFKK